MKTPTPAELRAATKAIDVWALPTTELEDISLAISTELHLDEVREAILRAMGECYGETTLLNLKRALDFLTK